MRLTDVIRQAFVRAVMDDVPQTDYDEEIRIIATNSAVARLPEKIRAIWEDKSMRDWVTLGQVRIDRSWIYLPTLDQGHPITAQALVQCERLRELKTEQSSKMRGLREKVEAVAKSVTTTQKLALLLPEFAKYLPKDDDKTAGLPAVVGVVDAFCAAGWPAGRVATAA